MGHLDHDLDFYLALARSARGPVLDLCCGTGRVLLPCLKAGAEVDGVDLSPALLATASAKAAALGFSPRLEVGNMNNFRLGRQYALVIIPFNAFVHNLTTEDQISTLECCREHLLPGGLLAFDTYFPSAAIITAPDSTRVLELEIKHPSTGLPVRIYDVRSFDRVAQVQQSLMEVEFLDPAGNVAETRRMTTAVRWIYKGEMALLLRAAGFARWKIYGGFDRRPLLSETDLMIVEAWAGN
jgi:SAM-dependent methyltransferase